MRARRLATIIVTLMIIVGLSLVLYPTLSDYLKSLTFRRAIADYRSEVEALDEVDYEALLAAARDYNRRLAARGRSMQTLDEDLVEEYLTLLDVTGSGVMGYVSIPKISVYLPVYHGTSDAVLQVGVGHLEGSSLPVGGTKTHSVLSGHTGLPSAKLFTSVDQLTVGDTFTVTVLKEVLTYEVDDIQIVLPNELSVLKFVDGQDYCTLLTCTPYGVNTHRLLIRGHRIPTPETEGSVSPVEELLGLEDGRIFGFDAEIVMLAAAIALVLLILLIALLVRHRRKKKAKRAEQEEKPRQDGESS